ncbi:hypothetical protein GCM10009734_96560 [Nonomuraea bangladeshensis]
MGGDEAAQLGGELPVPPEVQVGLHPVLRRGETQLLQRARRVLRVRGVGQRRAPPQLQRLAQQPGGTAGIAGREGPATGRSKRWASTSDGSTASR